MSKVKTVTPAGEGTVAYVPAKKHYSVGQIIWIIIK